MTNITDEATKKKKRPPILARPEHGVKISGKEAFERLNTRTPNVMKRLAD